MTRGNFTFYLNGLPYDGADHVLLLAKEEAKRYNKAITIRCTFTDDELITHRDVEYATLSPSGNLSWSTLFR